MNKTMQYSTLIMLLLLVISHSITMAQSGINVINQSLRVASGGIHQEVVFGLGEESEDNFDVNIDLPAPPVSPSPSFDARIIREEGTFPSAYFKDIRAFKSEEVFHLRIRTGSTEDISFEWSTLSDPEGQFTLHVGNQSVDLTTGGALQIIVGAEMTIDALIEYSTVVLNAPRLIVPANGEEGLSGTPFFQWDGVSDAISYQLQVAVDSTFADVVVDEEEIPSTHHEVGALSYSTMYYWRVRAAGTSVFGPWSSTYSFATGVGTSIERIDEKIPADYVLYSAFPNPFSSSTTLPFSLPDQQRVNLSVFDLAGKKVSTVVNSVLPAGRYRAVWNGASFASGVYIYRLETPGFVATKKFVLTK